MDNGGALKFTFLAVMMSSFVMNSIYIFGATNGNSKEKEKSKTCVKHMA